MTTSFIVLRHGETIENATGRWQGQLDGALTELGMAQAAAMGRRLRETSIDCVYASDLGRTQHTAQLITAQIGHDIRLDPRLRERHYGIFQSLTTAEMAERHPEAWARHLSADPDFALPGGESQKQLRDRSLAFFHEAVVRHADQTVLVVTHGGVLNCLLRFVLGLTLQQPRRFAVRHTAFNRFAHSDDGWMLEVWGDISHLAELPAPGSGFRR